MLENGGTGHKETLFDWLNNLAAKGNYHVFEPRKIYRSCCVEQRWKCTVKIYT